MLDFRTPKAPRPRAGMLAVIVVLLAFVPLHQNVSAKAPPLATAVIDTAVYDAPDFLSDAIGTLPAGTEIELTGDAAPGFVAVYYADTVVWVPAQYLALSDRPGIDTAVAVVDTALLDAPMRDAAVVADVPEGAAVILTGASVDGYDAASHEGSGGWIDGRDIAR